MIKSHEWSGFIFYRTREDEIFIYHPLLRITLGRSVNVPYSRAPPPKKRITTVEREGGVITTKGVLIGA